MNSILHRVRRVLPLAALLLSVPACAQRTGQGEHRETRGETWISIEDHDGYHSEVRATGDLDLNDAGDWVTSVAPGGSLILAERGRGQDRRIEFLPGDGGVRTRYRVEGDERPLDAAGRTWARGMISRAVRESGLGAERRVARMRQQGGVGAVLNEIARLETDSGRRAYYLALLRGGEMSNAEFGRVMADVGRRMGSDTETRLVLNEAVDRASGAGRLAALLNAAVGMESDTETRLVLNHVAERHRLEDAASRDAFFRAVGGMESDTETRLVLNAVAEQRLAEGAGREAFFRAVDGIGSDVERRLVLSSVLDQDPSEATVVAALRSAAGMDSDTEKRLVLMQVPSPLLRRAPVTAAYRQVVSAMRSATERGLALRHMAGGR